MDLSNCTGVVDVSALGGVHDLYLGGCTGVLDVGSLGTVHNLRVPNLESDSGVYYSPEWDYDDIY